MSRKSHCSNDTQFQPACLSFDMARCSWQVQRACTIARLSPCSLWPFSFSLKSIDAKMAGQQHLGLFLFLSGPFGAWFYEENGHREKMKCTSFPFEMYTKPTAGRPRSAAVNAPSRTQTIILQVVYWSWRPSLGSGTPACSMCRRSGTSVVMSRRYLDIQNFFGN